MVALAAAAVVVTLGPVAHAATAPTAPFDALTVKGTHANPLLPPGESRVFDDSNSTITGGAADTGGIQLSVTAPQGAWSAVVTPPLGGELTVGSTYPTTTVSGDDTHAGFTLTGEGHSCGASSTGTVAIKELVRDGDTVTAFAVSYTYDCSPPSVPIEGEIRYQSQIGYAAGTISPGSIDFGPQDIGQDGTPRTLTYTSLGSEPITIATVAVGADDNVFLIATTCAGQSLAYGQTCTITITPHATVVGPESVDLVVNDNTGNTGRLVPLSLFGKVGAAGTFYPLSPTRILDTRSGTGASKAPIGPGAVLHLAVAGHGGVPATGVGAVVLNVTVTAPSVGGYLTVYPTGTTRPTASSINFPAGWTGANSVTVPLGAGGAVDIFNFAGTAQVIADVVGFYAGNDDLLGTASGLGGQFQTTIPGRLLDTRQGFGALDPHGAVLLSVDFKDAAVNANVKALAVNITAVNPSSGGYLTAWNGVGNPPLASTLNFDPGRVVPNFAIVPTAPCNFAGCSQLPMMGVYNGSPGLTDVLVDLFGFYDNSSLPGGLRFHPLPPTRIVDSRTGLGLAAAIPSNGTVAIDAPGTVADNNTFALQFNLTAVNPTSSTYLTVWPAGLGLDRPVVSNLDPAIHQTVSNAVVTLVGNTNGFQIYNLRGTTNVVIDVNGSFQTGVAPGGASGLAPNTASRTRRLDPAPGGTARLAPFA